VGLRSLAQLTGDGAHSRDVEMQHPEPSLDEAAVDPGSGHAVVGAAEAVRESADATGITLRRSSRPDGSSPPDP
jgi:hypothetical protein